MFIFSRAYFSSLIFKAESSDKIGRPSGGWRVKDFHYKPMPRGRGARRLRAKNEGEVLVLDPDDKARAHTCLILKEAGLIPVELPTAKQVIGFLDRQSWSWSPWIVMVDFLMPGLGGFLFIHRLTERYAARTMRIVVTSSSHTSDDVNEAEVAGASAFLSKPISKHDIVTAVARMYRDEENHRAFYYSRTPGHREETTS